MSRIRHLSMVTSAAHLLIVYAMMLIGIVLLYRIDPMCLVRSEAHFVCGAITSILTLSIWPPEVQEERWNRKQWCRFFTRIVVFVVGFWLSIFFLPSKCWKEVQPELIVYSMLTFGLQFFQFIGFGCLFFDQWHFEPRLLQ
jgi:hypothetical protein